MSRRAGVAESAKKLLKAVPGLNIVEGPNICCGKTAQLTVPEAPDFFGPNFVEKLTRETVQSKADYLINICQLCRMSFYPLIYGKEEYPFSLKDIPSLINESMGGEEYEDKWNYYSKCEGIEGIINKTRENFEKNGFTEQDIRQMLPFFIVDKSQQVLID
jgi:hypothetical protein